MDEGESSSRVAREEDGESERKSDACNCGQAFQDAREKWGGKDMTCSDSPRDGPL